MLTWAKSGTKLLWNELFCKALILSGEWSQQESNLHLKFRKLLFYPLNYETFLYRGLRK